jgi:hypothetical protein
MIAVSFQVAVDVAVKISFWVLTPCKKIILLPRSGGCSSMHLNHIQ